jgi:hypothetical protein
LRTSLRTLLLPFCDCKWFERGYGGFGCVVFSLPRSDSMLMTLGDSMCSGPHTFRRRSMRVFRDGNPELTLALPHHIYPTGPLAVGGTLMSNKTMPFCQTADGGAELVCRLNLWRKGSLYTQRLVVSWQGCLAEHESPLHS